MRYVQPLYEISTLFMPQTAVAQRIITNIFLYPNPFPQRFFLPQTPSVNGVGKICRWIPALHYAVHLSCELQKITPSNNSGSHPFHPLCVRRLFCALATLSNGMNYGRARLLTHFMWSAKKGSQNIIHIQLGNVCKPFSVENVYNKIINRVGAYYIFYM